MRFIRVVSIIVVLIFANSLCCFASAIRAFVGVKTPVSLHPYESSDGITSDHLNQIFEPLFWIDYEGNLAPALALEWQRIDDYTIEVKLRHGVFFHNGEVFDSKAVKFTFDLFTDPLTKAPNRFYGSTISKVEIIDAYTVRVISNVPDSLLVYRLAIVGLIIPPEYYHQVGKKYFSEHPIGTGPFKFDHLVQDQEFVLIANDDYWGGRPKVDRIELKYFPNVDEAVRELLRGELDFVAHIPGKYGKQIQLNNELKLVKVLTRQSIMMLVNSKKNGFLQSVKFRKLLRAGVNVDDVIKYGYNGNGRISHSLTVEGEPIHNNTLKPIEWRPQAAKEYISKNGINKHEFKMLITKPFDLPGTIIANQMKQLGLKLNVEYGSDEEEQEKVLMKNQKGQAPEIDFLLSYCSHKDGLGVFPLLILLHSKGNWSLTSDAGLDKLLDSAIGEFDPDIRAMKFQEANKYIYDNAFLLPGFQLQDLFAVRKEIMYKPHVTAYLYFKDTYYGK